MTAKEQSMIEEKGNGIVDKAKEIAHKAEEKVTDVTHTAGEKLEVVADKLRKGTSAAAAKVKEAGTFLQENDMQSMLEKLAGVVKDNPIPSLIVGLVGGFFVGRILAR